MSEYTFWFYLDSVLTEHETDKIFELFRGEAGAGVSNGRPVVSFIRSAPSLHEAVSEPLRILEQEGFVITGVEILPQNQAHVLI